MASQVNENKSTCIQYVCNSNRFCVQAHRHLFSILRFQWCFDFYHLMTPIGPKYLWLHLILTTGQGERTETPGFNQVINHSCTYYPERLKAWWCLSEVVRVQKPVCIGWVRRHTLYLDLVSVSGDEWRKTKSVCSAGLGAGISSHTNDHQQNRSTQQSYRTARRSLNTASRAFIVSGEERMGLSVWHGGPPPPRLFLKEKKLRTVFIQSGVKHFIIKSMYFFIMCIPVDGL